MKVTLAVLGATAHAEEKEFWINCEKGVLQIWNNFASAPHSNFDLCLNSDFCSFFLYPKSDSTFAVANLYSEEVLHQNTTLSDSV